MAEEYRDRIRRAIERLRTSDIVGEDELAGCSETEIREIERTAELELPAAYEFFLREMGHSAGDFLRGDDLYYPDMLGLTSGLRQLVAENGGSVDLPETMFAFVGHHDYVFLYFDVNSGDDPPVYRYVDGDDETERVFDTFTAWLATSVDDERSLAAF